MSGAEEGGVSEQDLHEQLLPSSEGEEESQTLVLTCCPALLQCSS